MDLLVTFYCAFDREVTQLIVEKEQAAEIKQLLVRAFI